MKSVTSPSVDQSKALFIIDVHVQDYGRPYRMINAILSAIKIKKKGTGLRCVRRFMAMWRKMEIGR